MDVARERTNQNHSANESAVNLYNNCPSSLLKAMAGHSPDHEDWLNIYYKENMYQEHGNLPEDHPW